MIRFLVNVAISVGSSAVALIVCSLMLSGFGFTWEGFVMAAIIFTLAQAILYPIVVKLARKYASGLMGVIGLISTFLALWVASLLHGGLRISGGITWILAALIVWIITALGAWLLPLIFLKRKDTAKS